jgi:hypothetical protein
MKGKSMKVPRDMISKVDDLVKMKLPSWASIEEFKQWDSEAGKDLAGEKIVVSGEVIYPMFLKILGFPEKDPTFEQVECARQVMTIFLKKDIVKRFAGDQETMMLRITTEPEKIWDARKYKKSGQGYDPTTEYKRVKDTIWNHSFAKKN